MDRQMDNNTVGDSEESSDPSARDRQLGRDFKEKDQPMW